MSTLLEVRDLRSGYGRIPILFGLDMTVQDGEYLGILGHNGMGKTTTLRALMGHLPTTGGTVTLSGQADHPSQAARTVQARDRAGAARTRDIS